MSLVLFVSVVIILVLACKNKISQVAPAQGDIDPEKATVGPPPAPCLRGDEATVRAQALANYETFHALPSGTATEDQVARSMRRAGPPPAEDNWISLDSKSRWAIQLGQSPGPSWTLTKRSSAMDGAGVVAKAAGAGLGEESLTDEELAMQSLRHQEEEEEGRQREDEASLALARELKHEVDPVLPPGTATEDQVAWSSAVIQGWAAADLDTKAEGWGLTGRIWPGSLGTPCVHSVKRSAMDGAGVVAEAAGAGLGEEARPSRDGLGCLTDEELAMQSLRQEEEEEERRQREDEASLALARELKHEVNPASAPPLEEVHVVAGELLEPLAQDADQHAGPIQVQKNQAPDKDAEAIVEQTLRMQVPVLFFVRALVRELLVACAVRLKSDTRTRVIFDFDLLNQQLLHAERLSVFESLSFRQVLLIDELLNEADRTANTEQREKKMQEKMTAMEQERAAEIQQKLAALQEQAKAEQAKLQLAVEKKMAAMEEANRRGKEERERIAQEKVKLAAERSALDALAAEKQSLEALWEELRKKEQEISTKEELLAKERAQRNEAMAELALLKAQLAQAKRDQETAFQEVPPVHPTPVPPFPPSLRSPLSPLSLSTS
jgi:hypothetical protein